MNVIIKIFIMRSLYTNDIPGANPTIRYFEKRQFREKHNEQIERFADKGKRIIDWYSPMKRHVEPIENDNFPVKVSKFSPKQNNPEGRQASPMTLSKIIESKNMISGKVTQGISIKQNKSSILSRSGMSSLSRKDLDDNPYFPHMYRDYDREYHNKWQGKRQWKGDSMEKIEVPPTNSQYFAKWT